MEQVSEAVFDLVVVGLAVVGLVVSVFDQDTLDMVGMVFDQGTQDMVGMACLGMVDMAYLDKAV